MNNIFLSTSFPKAFEGNTARIVANATVLAVHRQQQRLNMIPKKKKKKNSSVATPKKYLTHSY